MIMYTIKGEIKRIGEVKQVTDSFKKRDLVLIDKSGYYEQTILLQFAKDRVDNLNQYKPGEQVEVTFFLRGREWTNPKSGEVSVFNTLDGWKIDYTGEHADAIQGTIQEQAHAGEDEDTSLPF